MTSWLWFIGTAIVMAAMLFVAFRMEPHWSSKDGTRFICRAQPVSLEQGGAAGSRWREVRGEVTEAGLVRLRTRGLISGRKMTGDWRIDGRGTTDGRKRVVYLLRSSDGDDPRASGLLALRMPGSSRTVAVIEQHLH